MIAKLLWLVREALAICVLLAVAGGGTAALIAVYFWIKQ